MPNPTNQHHKPLEHIADPKVEKRITRLVALVFVLLSLIFIYRTSFVAIDGRRYFCLFDDAMISMRYAWNFSHGAGLVWNAGEYVQGYTNLLMTLIMALATWIFNKSIAALFIQILGIGFMLSIAYASMRIADFIFIGNEDPSQRALLRILSFVFALSYYPLIYWSLTGMETGLLTVLLLWGVIKAFQYIQSGKLVHIFAMSLCLSLAFLTRNDSLILAILLWAYVFHERIKKQGDYKRLLPIVSVLALYLTIITVEFLFQYFYYGDLLPNTFILKLTGMSLFDRISNGLGFILPFLVQVSFILVAAIIDTYLHFTRQKLLLLTLFLSTVGYQIYVGGDAWNYWRMMSPTIPLLGILFISLVNSGIRSGEGKNQLFLKYSPNVQINLLFFMAIVVVNAYFLPEILFLERPFYVSANQHNVDIAVALSEVTTQNASAGVFWAGAIPYFYDRKAIDFLGKSDRYIAHLPPDLSGKIGFNGMKSPPGHNKYDLDYSIKQLQPTYAQGFEWGSQDLTTWAETRYMDVNYKGVQLYLRKGSPDVLWEKIAGP
jgi:hypothetical protein